jgi:hypothetical protein
MCFQSRNIIALAFSATIVAASPAADISGTPPTGFKHASLSELPTLKLKADFDAIGDGVADDTAAVAKAVNAADLSCIDGEGLTYKVIGSIRGEKDVCLRNMHLLQARPPVDTRKYIKSAGHPQQRISAADGSYVSYPEDPVLNEAEHAEMLQLVQLRTLTIGGARELKVSLSNVKITKGQFPELGDRSQAAGLNIVNANPVNLDNVEVTGLGQGIGIRIAHSRNVRLSHVNVHDLYWKPYWGDRPLIESVVRDQFNWNNNPVYRYHGSLRKFVRVRVQETASGIVILSSDGISIRNSRITNLGAIFDRGGHPARLPFQADGITISGRNVEISDTTVRDTWEGIDLTGAEGGQDVLLRNLLVEDSLVSGIKLAHKTKNVIIRDSVIRNSGMAGIIVAAPASDVKIAGVRIYETGVRFDAGSKTYVKVWYDTGDRPLANISGLLVMNDPEAPTTNLRVVSSEFSNRVFPKLMRHGLFNNVPSAAHVIAGNIDVFGARADGESGFAPGGVGFAGIQTEYARINGCTGDEIKLIDFWDRTVTPPSGEQPWDMSRITAHFVDLKARNISYCK